MRSIAAKTALSAFALFVLTQAATAQEVAGSWRGTWNDTRSGHQGPLKAAITKCDDTRYNAVFTGRFFGVFPFRFTAALTVTGHDGEAVLLSGSSNLGVMFGTFTYSARVTQNCFVADFCSRRYQGRFVMERACPGPCLH
jgi:hypothetical protein